MARFLPLQKALSFKIWNWCNVICLRAWNKSSREIDAMWYAESLKCAPRSLNSCMQLHFIFIPESMVPAKLATTIPAKSRGEAGTDNCGCSPNRCALQINVGITSYPAALPYSLHKKKRILFSTATCTSSVIRSRRFLGTESWKAPWQYLWALNYFIPATTYWECHLIKGCNEK